MDLLFLAWGEVDDLSKVRSSTWLKSAAIIIIEFDREERVEQFMEKIGIIGISDNYISNSEILIDDGDTDNNISYI